MEEARRALTVSCSGCSKAVLPAEAFACITYSKETVSSFPVITDTQRQPPNSEVMDKFIWTGFRLDSCAAYVASRRIGTTSLTTSTAWPARTKQPLLESRYRSRRRRFTRTSQGCDERLRILMRLFSAFCRLGLYSHY